MMRCRVHWGWALLGLLAIAIAASLPSAFGATTTSSTSSDSSSSAAGVVIDANGVLRMNKVDDPSGQLMRERIASAKAALDPKVSSFSKLRKISINRLERSILEHQGTLTEEMRCLAGLLRVKYVFYYPDSKDIVLAGPAEGWATDPAGRIVGLTSHRPIVQLQDLVVALRTFSPDREPASLIGCSIDPTEEGLAAMQQFLRSVGSTATPDQTQTIVDGLRTSLGLQKVSILGISPKTHFAQVLVEADYRMKLIGIGLEQPPVKMISYVDRARPGDISRNAMQRWYFTPDYQCVRTSNDKLAMELVGDGVKLIGEDEMVTADGQRHQADRGSKASHEFVASFTRKYSELAERSPVYAELRNLIDLSIAAAFIREQDYVLKAGWKMAFFGDESAFPVEVYNVPQTVETAVNALWRGHTLVTPVGGGVNIEAEQALNPNNVLSDDKGTVAKHREGNSVPELAPGQWWWD
jgi:hypothetical protein